MVGKKERNVSGTNEMTQLQPIIVDETWQGERIDAYLAHVLAEFYSRTRIKKMIGEGMIRVDGRIISPHHPVRMGEKIEIEGTPEEDTSTRAEDIPLDILHEDEDIIIVNKAAGMVVHPAHGNLEHTLVNALLFHTQKLSTATDPVRPGIVHRLDKDTSGILVIAKNELAHAYISNQFKKHTIERTYFTVVKGIVQHDEGICEEPVGRAFLNRKKVVIRPSGGKNATTFFHVEKRLTDSTLLRVHPKTGRTHQIRVHMAHVGHPVIGDALYGVLSPWIQRQALHAVALGFIHPRTKKKVYFESDLPEDMKYLISQLESKIQP